MPPKETPFRAGRYEIEITVPMSREMYSVATAMWEAKKPITEGSLTEACNAVRISSTPQKIKEMVQFCDLFNRICPA